MRLPALADQLRLAPIRALRAIFAGVGQLLLAADRLRAEGAAAGEQPADAGNTHDPLRHGGPAGARAGSDAERAGQAERGPRPRPGGRAVSDGRGRAVRRARASDGAQARRPAGRAGRGPGQPPRPEGDGAPSPQRWRSLDSTGNVRVLTPEELAESGPPGAAATPGTPEAPGTEGSLGSAEAQAGPVTPGTDGAPGAPEASGMARPPAGDGGAAAPAAPIVGYDGLSLPSVRARLRTLDAGTLREILAYERAHANRADFVTMYERRIARLTAGEA